jgi:pilus assembly protein CpaB
MFVRNILLFVGGLCLLGGVALAVVWYMQTTRQHVDVQQQLPPPAVLVATHAIANGTLLRPEDIGWKEVGPAQVGPGSLVRGQVSESAFVGAIARRKFAADEPLIAADLLKPSERQFLSAVLKPGTRAVSIPVDAPQSAAGLILPGDQVDVILTQSFGDTGNIARKSVAETVLRDVRIIAVDQSLGAADKAPAGAQRAAFSVEGARVPKTVTFEVSERQAQELFLAAQLGNMHIAVRPLEAQAGGEAPRKPETQSTWAADISPALIDLARHQGQVPSPVEAAVRRPPPSGQ